MEIGGYDLLFDKPSGMTYADLEAGILKVCKSFWPDMVIEYDDLPDSPPTWHEFFIYENQRAKDLWDEKGYSRRYTHNSMVYVIIDEEYKHGCHGTIVVDNPTGYKVKHIISGFKEIFPTLHSPYS